MSEQEKNVTDPEKKVVRKKTKKRAASGENTEHQNKAERKEKAEGQDKTRKSRNSDGVSSDDGNSKRPVNKINAGKNKENEAVHTSEKETSIKKKSKDIDNKDVEKKSKRRRGRKKSNGKKTGKKVAIVLGSLAGVMAVVYIALGAYFSSHFMFYTKINGTDCAMMSVTDIEAYMEQQVEDYVLTLKESDGDTEEIAGADIGAKYVPDDKVADLMKEQNNWLWIKTLWDHPEISAEVGVKYDENALEEKIQTLQCMIPENQTESVNAHPVFKEDKFVVEPEVIGTKIDTEKFNAAVAKAINGFQSELDLAEAGCYNYPKYTSESAEVIAAADAMNSYLGAEVTYDFNPHTEVVDSAKIAEWISVDGDMNVTFNEAAVGDYVMELANKYNTLGGTRTFTSATGASVTVEGGEWGWQIDQASEVAALIENIKNGEVVTREPAYYSRGATHEDGNDIGQTYAEVDLTNQIMYYVKDGQIAMQAYVVTGNPNTNHGTPSGVFSILYKESPSILRGQRQANGKPEYETQVSFWMPFSSDGCGFHDATWQSAFGGSRYLSVGSHGCVNMSYSEAQQLFGMIESGTPVVVHY